MKAHPAAEGACPLAAVDQRLADAHTLWHQAEGAYFEPDRFRLAVQNAIQTLRTVTFLVQKNQRKIPGFDGWYAIWQECLRGDPLMRWLVDARNKIEKQGDLEAHSIVRAEILASYLDEGPRMEIPAHLFESPEALLGSILVASIPDSPLGEHVRRNGVLRILRRWVENALPDYELLDAVAIAFGKLRELVHDAHRQIGLDPPRMIHDDTGESYDLAAMGWRFPCMIGHDLPRTLRLSLADGSRVEFESRSVHAKLTAAEAASLLDRDGENPYEAMGREYKTDADLAAGYFEMARRVFLRDGYHLPIPFLFRERKPVKFFAIRVENVKQKYLLMRQLADEVTKSGADAVITIGESWGVRADALKVYERPSDSPDRIEFLDLGFCSKRGEPSGLMAKIQREGSNVSLSETEVLSRVTAFEFAPFYQAWGRKILHSWIETASAGIDGAKKG